MKSLIRFKLNGHEVEVEAPHHWTLLRLLREGLGYTGTKEGCGSGECGACTVIVDGLSVNSCLYPALEIEGCDVLTIEGLALEDGELHPIQKAFVEYGAVQCGYCSPGMVLSAKALLDRNPHPDEEEIRHALAGNICRCTGYIQIYSGFEPSGHVVWEDPVQ
ncbi:MAG: (2Fe-2S)-binding protein [Deltaproteobacteria bacterium]|nr:(2Fe-2S)-binding protein [Deltaproteobacteria bacterium]